MPPTTDRAMCHTHSVSKRPLHQRPRLLWITIKIQDVPELLAADSADAPGGTRPKSPRHVMLPQTLPPASAPSHGQRGLSLHRNVLPGLPSLTHAHLLSKPKGGCAGPSGVVSRGPLRQARHRLYPRPPSPPPALPEGLCLLRIVSLHPASMNERSLTN